MKKLCMIGSGNMGKAMVRGILKTGLLKPEEIVMTDLNAYVVEDLERELGIVGCTDNREAVADSEIIVLAVKPQFLDKAIASLSDAVKPGSIVISIAPGKTVEMLEAQFPAEPPIIRAMPNAPALVLTGMTAVCRNKYVKKSDMERVKKLFDGFGLTREVPEYMMDAVTAVSGSCPAYVCLMIEALSDSAVKSGMTRKDSYIFAEQAVMGSAKLLLETGMHPGELKDIVCSPAGTSIEAVQVLEDSGFRSAVIRATDACAKRSRELV